MNNLCWVTLPITNVEKSIKFYTEILEMEIDSNHSHDNITIIMLGNKENAKVELFYSDDNKNKDIKSTISVGIKVESLKNLFDKCTKNNIKVNYPPTQPHPTINFAFINDPDGYTIQLVEFKNKTL